MKTKPAPARKADPVLRPVGEITHYFSKIAVCVLRVDQGELRRGARIQVREGKGRFVQTVTSMQVESVDVAVARKGQLVGLKVDRPVSPGDLVYKAASR